jgi:hypothetical protein
MDAGRVGDRSTHTLTTFEEKEKVYQITVWYRLGI